LKNILFSWAITVFSVLCLIFLGGVNFSRLFDLISLSALLVFTFSSLMIKQGFVSALKILILMPQKNQNYDFLEALTGGTIIATLIPLIIILNQQNNTDVSQGLAILPLPLFYAAIIYIFIYRPITNLSTTNRKEAKL